MITYEEFIKQNNTKSGNLIGLNFDRECKGVEAIYANIYENHNDYIEVAKGATELRSIHVSGTGDVNYYNEVTAFIQNCNENVKVINGMVGEATKEEFLEAEEIISKIIAEIDPNWSIKQKSAYVHYKIGETVSYLSDFKSKDSTSINSKPQDVRNARNIWKSIVQGESVCNGIVSVERTILSRLGINTQALESETGTHTFLLIEAEDRNIITDPTWDLSNTLYKSKPMFFGVTYDYLREQDGCFSRAHKLTNPPENVTEISDEELREIYHSIGLTTEDRKFLFPIMHRVEDIDSQKFDSVEQKIDTFLEVLTQEFPKETMHLQETRSLIEDIISSFGIKRMDIDSRFVYSKDDRDCKTPHLVMHFNTEEMKNKVKFLNTAQMQFQDMGLRQFDQNYKAHNFRTDKPFWKAYIQDNIQEQPRDYDELSQ